MKLYDANGHIKINKIKSALKRAKRKGELKKVPSYKIEILVDGLEEKIEELRRKVGNKITRSEMELLLNQLKRERSDNLYNSEIETMEEILLDKDFEFF